MVSTTWFLSLLYSFSLNLGRHKPRFLSSSRLIQFCLSLSVHVCLQRAEICTQRLSIREEVQHVLYYVHLNNSNPGDCRFCIFFGGVLLFSYVLFFGFFLSHAVANSDCYEYACEWASKTFLFEYFITIATAIIIHLAPSVVHCVLNVSLVCGWFHPK